MGDEFYIGYLAKSPPRLARFVRRLVIGLVVGGLGLAALISARQPAFDYGVFEFGSSRTFAGTLRANPYPTLLVRRPGLLPRPGGAMRGVSSYSLVGFGKLSDSTDVEKRDGQAVELEGSLVFNEGSIMIEVADGTVAPTEDRPAPPGVSLRRIGVHTLIGEIVDSKCFLGVMKPGRGKSHRACASLCIRGGIPASLLVETTDGQRLTMLLIDEAGHPVDSRVLDYVAEPVQITGQVRRDGDLMYLVADPGTYERVN